MLVFYSKLKNKLGVNKLLHVCATRGGNLVVSMELYIAVAWMFAGMPSKRASQLSVPLKTMCVHNVR